MGGVLIISPAPQVQILGNTTACQGDTISLTASGAATYTWSNGSNAPSIHVLQSGTIGLTGTSGLGCSGTDSIQISFNPPPLVALTAADTLFCANEAPIALQATPPGGNFGGDQILGSLTHKTKAREVLRHITHLPTTTAVPQQTPSTTKWLTPPFLCLT